MGAAPLPTPISGRLLAPFVKAGTQPPQPIAPIGRPED